MPKCLSALGSEGGTTSSQISSTDSFVQSTFIPIITDCFLSLLCHKSVFGLISGRAYVF